MAKITFENKVALADQPEIAEINKITDGNVNEIKNSVNYLYDNPVKGDKGDTGATGPQGPKGDKGDTGNAGAQGPAGQGVAAGGTTGQILKKKSNTNYDTEWGDAPSGGGASIPSGTNGYLATHSGTAGTFGTPVNSTPWQKSQVPAGTSGQLLTASGTAGNFGTPINQNAFATAAQGAKADTALQSIPNASNTTVGGVKLRLDGATSTLYITNNGNNP